MKFARFWSRDAGEAIDDSGKRIRMVARGWSDESVEAARAKAREIATRLAQRVAIDPSQRNNYGYGDRPLPEPVLWTFPGAAVTRNVYGALVLNADEMMFVDIDRKEDTPALVNPVSKLLSFFSTPGPAAVPVPFVNPVVEGVRGVVERNGLSARLYRTAAGHRAIITSRKFHAGGPESESLLNEFGADPLYIQLCRLQTSFRARLTPKPWRCNFSSPPGVFPFETPQADAAFRQWEQKYNWQAIGFATCQFVATFGQAPGDPAFHDLIGYHDQETKVASNLPLA